MTVEQIRDIGTVKGTVFDLPHAMSLSPSDCNVLVVSSRTLFFVQLFGTGELDFLSRYASSFLEGNKYILAEDSADLDDINDLVNNYELEVQPVTCDLVTAIEALTAATISAGAGCCPPYGETPPPPAPDTGDPDTEPPPADWSTWAEYYTYKCKAANMIVDNWIDSLAGLATLSGVVAAIGALLLGAFVYTSLLSGLLVGLMMLGFSAGAAAALIIGALIYLIAGGAQLLVYFLEVSNDMEDTKADLVCLLYVAESVVDAKQAVITFTSDIAENIIYDPADNDTLFKIQLDAITDALFNDAIINILFEENADANVYVGDVDCDACPGPGGECAMWSFETDEEGWSFQDISDPSCSASRLYDALGESLEITLTVASLPFVEARGLNLSPSISLPVTAAGRIEVDHSGTSDGETTAIVVRAIYNDLTEYETTVAFILAGTVALNFSAAGSLVRVEVEIARSTAGSAIGTISTANIEEVRVYCDG